MEPLKISELSGITSPNTSTSIIPIVSSGVTYNMTLNSLSQTIVDDKIHVFRSGQIFDGPAIVNGDLIVNGRVYSNTLVPITYDDLMSQRLAGSLVPGIFYQIVDFQTVYWMIDDLGVEINDGVPIYGEIEPIIVFATSENRIGINAISPFFHNDILEYEWDPDEFINDAAFSNLVGLGFKGVITYREDVRNNLSSDWDFRNVKFRRWTPIAPEWVDSTFYAVHDVVHHDFFIFKCIADNINREPSILSSSGFWVQLLNLNDNPYWSPNSISITFDGVTISSGLDYEDFYSFNLLSNVKNNNLRTSQCIFGSISTQLSNIVLVGDADGVKLIDSNVRAVTLGNGAKSFEFKSDVKEIIAGSNCSNIIIHSGSYNLILSDDVDNGFFDNNSNNSIIGTGCSNIVMGTDTNNIVVGSFSDSLNFSSHSYLINTGTYNHDILFMPGCNNITVNDTCHTLSFGAHSEFISIGLLSSLLRFDAECKFLIIPNNSINTFFNIGCSNGDFTNSTWIIRLFNKWVVINEDGDLKLTYFGGDNIHHAIDINV